MDNSKDAKLKVFTLEEIKEQFIENKELFDFKLEMVERLNDILNQSKFLYTDAGRSHFFSKEIKKLIDEI